LYYGLVRWVGLAGVSSGFSRFSSTASIYETHDEPANDRQDHYGLVRWVEVGEEFRIQNQVWSGECELAAE
jgi:hypothetical protein